MQNPLVSIIIPTYNRAHLIGETLDSVLAQTYENWECIIVDDGSTDDTVAVVLDYVKKDARFQYYKRLDKYKAGGNGARNYGFELSKGEYVNWFDDDDIMSKDFIQFKIEALTPTLNFVITTGVYVSQDLSNPQPIDLYQPEILFKEYVLWKLQILTPSVLFKREFLKEINLFNLILTRGQESEFFSRVFFKRAPQEYKIVNKPLFLYRQHNESKTQQNNAYVKSFKFSQTFIAIENFNKAIELKEAELLNYYYRALLNYFFLAVENQHLENAGYILKGFVPILKKVNYILALKFKIVASILKLLGRSSYRAEKYFKSQKIK